MKRTRTLLLPIAALALLLVPRSEALAQMGQISVEDGAIATQIVDRMPTGVDTTFASTVEELFCFTRIMGAQDTTRVTHVWYHGDEERARVDLPVRSPSWRTYSSKQIMAHETGAWRVEVLDASGNVVARYRFRITG